MAFVVFAVPLLSACGGGDSSSPESTTASRSRIVSEGELQAIARAVGHTVYWAGPMAGTELELVEEENGNVQVRYRKKGSPKGAPATADLVIGSYPFADPEAATLALADRPGAVMRRSPNGRVAVINKGAPSSVYFTSPDRSVQVEVYDPSPRRALDLALSGRMIPVR